LTSIDYCKLVKSPATVCIKRRDRGNPSCDAGTDVSAENIDLKLQLGSDLIAVDHHARLRCNELKAIQSVACALVRRLVTPFVKQ
jgi:hypothetical protein